MGRSQGEGSKNSELLGMASLPPQRILVFGDTFGIPELLARIPSGFVVGIVAAAVRPQYHKELKDLAAGLDLPLLVQPKVHSATYADFFSQLAGLRPDSLICHSYSMLIRGDILNCVGWQAFNIHMSLLPRNRGPNPIQWTIIHGDQVSGTTLHVMDEGFDSGGIIDQEPVKIFESDTWVTLASRLNLATGRLLDRAIPLLLSGTWQAMPQDECAAVHNARIAPESFRIDFATMSDVQIYNLIRAQVAPLRGAYLDTPSGRLRFTDQISLREIADMRRRYS